MTKLKETLSSRKFWAAVVASVGFALAEPPDWSSFAHVWMAYLGAVGLVEVSEKLGSRVKT
jgi:hypothetical protein